MPQTSGASRYASNSHTTSTNPAPSVARKLRPLQLCLAIGLVSALLGGSPKLMAQTGEEQVMHAVTALFDAMRAKDADALAAAFLAEGRLGAEEPQRWISQVSGSDSYLDEVTFDERVLIDDTMAMAWTPYNLFVNGQFHHCGVDLFSFRYVEGQWKILQIDDTRRTEGCDPKRRD